MQTTLTDKLTDFKSNYAELLEKNPESAREYFIDKFLVRCFNCGKLVKPTKSMNCPVCGTYFD